SGTPSGGSRGTRGSGAVHWSASERYSPSWNRQVAMPSEPRDIVARRTYRADSETVFRAFTDPALLPRWFSPSEEIPVDVLEFDAVVGGRYRLAYRLDADT